MSRWTPDKGWVTVLGAGFSHSYWDDRIGNDFLLETQARSAVETPTTTTSATATAGEEFPYLRQVLRLEMLAKYYGENDASLRKHCMVDPTQPWYALSLMQRTLLAAKGFVAAAKRNNNYNNNYNYRPSVPRQLPPSAENVTAMNKIERLFKHRPEEEEEETITWNNADVGEGSTPIWQILIPASRFSDRTKAVTPMKSILGGEQLYVVADGEVEYTLLCAPNDMLKTQKTYQLSCSVCTVHYGEKPMLLTVTNDSTTTSTTTGAHGAATSDYQVPVPYTVGMWAKTDPIEVELGGPDITKTKLRFKRQHGQFGGVVMKYIRLVEKVQIQTRGTADEINNDEDWVIVNH